MNDATAWTRISSRCIRLAYLNSCTRLQDDTRQCNTQRVDHSKDRDAEGRQQYLEDTREEISVDSGEGGVIAVIKL